MFDHNGNLFRKRVACFILGLGYFLLPGMSSAAPVELPRQLITLPASASEPMLADIEGDGLTDLLIIDRAAKRLLTYRQKANGFTNAPDQTLPLAPQTTWATMCDFEPHPGQELLLFTPVEVLYARQNGGLYESQWRHFISANQVFTNWESPVLTSLSTNGKPTLPVIPVIGANQVLLYHRGNGDEWKPASPITLKPGPAACILARDFWNFGSSAAQNLRLQQTFRENPEEEPEPENAAISILLEGELPMASAPARARVDVNGDSRMDVVVWQLSGGMEIKTDLYVFLGQTDQRWPEKPSQVLHLRGAVLMFGFDELRQPVKDLNGDGIAEMVLLEPKITFASPSQVLKMALSRGLEWSLTVRSFQPGGFPRVGSHPILVTAVLEIEDLNELPIRIQGDFNADRRPDLLVRRTESQWAVYLSRNDARWFDSEPALVFASLSRAFFKTEDLNSDGRADIVWHEPEHHRVSIFLSGRSSPKRRQP